VNKDSIKRMIMRMKLFMARIAPIILIQLETDFGIFIAKWVLENTIYREVKGKKII
jgi:hypothetical protein